jgi:hypothetical protein
MALCAKIGLDSLRWLAWHAKGRAKGGSFSIGSVIHSSRSVGFTGWIGGVAVFDRALSAEEQRRLAKLRQAVR